jgi:hypothetical protein
MLQDFNKDLTFGRILGLYIKKGRTWLDLKIGVEDRFIRVSSKRISEFGVRRSFDTNTNTPVEIHYNYFQFFSRSFP